MVAQQFRTSLLPTMAIGFFTVFLTLFTGGAAAQLGPGVKYHQKISDTEGGFTGALTDGDQFCVAAGLGDIDGDGVGDVAVGAPGDDDGGANRGAVWILFMNEDGTVKSHQKISDTAGNFAGALIDGDEFGWSVEFLGDLDGAGGAEWALAVGAEGDDDGGNNRGAVWILFMNEDGTVDAHQKISDLAGGFTGTLDDGDFFGYDVNSLGDLDGDGVVDLAVGARTDDDGGTDRGAVWILFMNEKGTVRSYQKISDTEGGFTGVLNDDDSFGASVTNIGDLDDDGVIDLAVGARNDDGGGTSTESERGAVWILFMSPDGTVESHQKINDVEGGFTGALEDNDYFGETGAALGDFDLDGVVDLAVGAFYDDDGGTNQGALWMLFLNPDGTVKSHQKISDTEGTFFGTLDPGDGFSVSPNVIGDLDGDGVVDLAVGAFGDNDGGQDRGAVWVLFMSRDVVDVPEDADSAMPGTYLVSSVPNPFNPRTTIHYELAGSANANLQIYDVAGRLVRSFDLSNELPGSNSIEWNGKDDRGREVADGTYLVRLSTRESRDAIRVTVLGRKR